MQEKQSVEQLGMELQRLARKAFPERNAKEFDHFLKGHFFQALLLKWQWKLGALKASESFNNLFTRARTFERHDHQFSASSASHGDTRQKGERTPKQGAHAKPQAAGEPRSTTLSSHVADKRSKTQTPIKRMFQLWRAWPHRQILHCTSNTVTREV